MKAVIDRGRGRQAAAGDIVARHRAARRAVPWLLAMSIAAPVLSQVPAAARNEGVLRYLPVAAAAVAAAMALALGALVVDGVRARSRGRKTDRRTDRTLRFALTALLTLVALMVIWVLRYPTEELPWPAVGVAACTAGVLLTAYQHLRYTERLHGIWRNRVARR